MKSIIVIGGHVQALGIVRILGKLGMSITVIDSTKKCLARHSKFCSNFELYPDGNLLEFLLERRNVEKYKGSIIFPTNDLHVYTVSKNKPSLSKYYTIASDQWSVVEKCYNKRLTYQIAEELNIPIPQTWMPNTERDLSDVDLSKPVVLKPAVMHTFYKQVKKKVFVCNTFEELRSNYRKAIKIIPQDEIIVQSVVDGKSEHLYSACFLFNKETEFFSCVGRRARQHPPDFGNATTYAHIVENKQLLDLSRKFLKSIGYTGVCEVEYKFDTVDNEYKLLEINPRTWKWHSIILKGGGNMLESYCQLLREEEVMAVPVTKRVSFRHLITDIPMVIYYRLKKLYKPYDKMPVQYAVWSFSDIKPAIFELLYLLTLIRVR